MSVLAFGVLMVRAIRRQFRECSVDPALARAADAWEAMDARAGAPVAAARCAWGNFMV